MFPIMFPPTLEKFISSTWGRDRSYRGPGEIHAGVDFPSPKGSPAFASADGIVSHVDLVSNSFAGKHIAIKHKAGVTSRYLHMDQIFVKIGDPVFRGQVIGLVGTTGTSNSAPHVHYDLYLDPKYLPAWKAEFGEPTTGFEPFRSGLGVGVPSEPLMIKVKYNESVKDFTKKLGVYFATDFHPAEWLMLGAVGFGMYMVLTS